MKNLIQASFFLLFFHNISANAQNHLPEAKQNLKSEKPLKIMAFFGHGTGMNGKTFSLGGTFLTAKNQGLSASILTNNHPTRKLPTHINTPGTGVSTNLPLNYLKMVNLSFVKLYPTTCKYVQLGFESGVDVYQYEHNEFTYKNNSSELGENEIGKYYVNRKTSTSAGISLRMKVVFPLTRLAGLEIIPGINFNKHAPLIGIQARLNIGLLR